MRHAAVFGKPMPSAAQVVEQDWDGVTYRVDDVIAFDATIWAREQPVRREGIILELWSEPWRDLVLLYAEVACGPEPRRVWFHRDHVGAPGSFGAVPEGALW